MCGCATSFFLTSSSCHPKIFVKEFCYFLMSCHQHCLGINLLVQRLLNLYGCDSLSQCKHLVYAEDDVRLLCHIQPYGSRAWAVPVSSS